MGTKRGTSRQKAASLAPRVCEIPFCGYHTITQRHRIKPGREKGKYLLGNVIALCPTHHAEADRTLEGRITEGMAGFLPPELLHSLVEARIKRDYATLQRQQAELRSRELEVEGADPSSESNPSSNGSEPHEDDGPDTGGSVSDD